jgi:hypothetical protein
METIFSGLLLAAITGLTALAYKHPEGYAKIHKVLSIILLLVVLSITSWNAAIDTFIVRILRASKSVDMSQIERVGDNLKVPFSWLVLGFMGIYGYLLFLDFLPSIVATKERKDK